MQNKHALKFIKDIATKMKRHPEYKNVRDQGWNNDNKDLRWEYILSFNYDNHRYKLDFISDPFVVFSLTSEDNMNFLPLLFNERKTLREITEMIKYNKGV